MKDKIKPILTSLLIVIGFIVISAIYFFPVLEGEGLVQNDNINAKGMAKEAVDFYEQTGQHTGWTNSMFGGMPTFQISSQGGFNIYSWIIRILRLGLPFTTIAILFTYLLGFYLLLLSMKFDNKIAIVGALAFALSSYNLIIIAAGHITKCYAIAYMAPVVAGLLFLYNKKYILGGLVFTFALGLEIACNHPQIVYYLAILCGLYVVYQAILAYKQKEYKVFAKASAVAAIAIVFAILPNILNLWTTWEYGKYSTRSQSELSNKQASTGLDKGYALSWSYGIDETFNLMIPNFKGGESGQLGNDETAVNAIKDSRMAQYATSFDHYWGNQPFTSGPVYIGAIVIFLFVLGLFIVKNSLKWWLLAATIVSIVLSWGYNAGWFTDLLFNYFPLYNKFRSVSMALVIAQLCIPLLAIMALKEYSDNPNLFKEKRNDFLYALAITAGICLVFWIAPSITSFQSNEEINNIARIKAEQPQSASQYDMLVNDVVAARKAIFRADCIRSLLFILSAFVIMFLYNTSKFSKTNFYVIIGLLIVFDMWIVDYRYLGPKHFHPVSDIDNILRPSKASEFILKDQDPDFRVLNLTTNVFNDGITPYFHKSIGGYHGAKLRRYQEFIDTVLAVRVAYAQNLASKAPENLQQMVTTDQAFNMLNTKFIIYDPNQMPIINMNSYGHAWFVKKYDIVDNADNEIGHLNKINTKETAVINKTLFPNFVNNLPKDQIILEDSSVVALTEYKPNYLKYNSLTKSDRLAVFSEIYYPKGWQAYIDGKPTEHACANYILRALIIPQGQHTIEFKFEPSSVKIGKAVAASSSIMLIIAVLIFAAKYISKQNIKLKKTDTVLEK